jgi:hypothetical protein
MQKFLLIVCVIFSISISTIAQVQKKDAKLFNTELEGISLIAPNAACDSIGWPVPAGLAVTWFTVQNNGGYVAGNNKYGDKGKGNFFDMTGSTANYLTRVILGLGPANGAGNTGLTKVVNIKVLDGTTGTPGSVIGTYASTLQEMNTRRLGFSLVTFSAPVSLPASKKIFLVLEFPSITWTESADPLINDSISLLTTGNTQPATNIAWEQWSDNTWHTFEEGWGLKAICHIYPLVSAAADGCGETLPVTFGGFNAKKVTAGVELNWQTWTETNNQRFEVERSTDAFKFSTVGTVSSKAIQSNHQGQLSYLYTDGNPTPGINYYRIRQVDNDGASSYTKVINISYQPDQEHSFVRNFYPNPAADKLFIQLGTGIRDVEVIRFSDASGKILSTQKPSISPDGIIHVSTKSLRSGLLFATIILHNGQQSTIKLLKN